MIFFQFFFVTMFENVRFPMNLLDLCLAREILFNSFSECLMEKCLNECDDNSVSTTIGDVLVKKKDFFQYFSVYLHSMLAF